MEETLTYSPLVSGWPSKMSFIPDWMLGMNNYFYTWKGGNLYRHNVNETRNNFYGTQYNSTIQTVLNDDVLTNKLFKTLAIQGDSGWTAEIETDIQTGATINEDWFVLKEGVWFGYIRNSNDVPATTEELKLRSVNGIARSTSFSGVSTALQVNFQTTPTIIQIPSSISVGDYIYFAVPPFTTPQYAGVITNIVRDFPNGENYLVINTTGGSMPTNQTDFWMAVKNGQAESAGLVGHLCIITLENSSEDKVELFAVQSDVSKSFP